MLQWRLKHFFTLGVTVIDRIVIFLFEAIGMFKEW